MSTTMQLTPAGPEPAVINTGPFGHKMDDAEFFEFCRLNKDWRIEQTSAGDLIIMPGTGGNTGRRNALLNSKLGLWAESDGSGQVFDSSTIFTLPNGAKRSPDSAWVSNDRWDALTVSEQEKFPPLCPDFVVELRSRTDLLADLQAKMEEYLANGLSLRLKFLTTRNPFPGSRC